MTAILVAAVLVAIPAGDRAEDCRYMTADGHPGYSTGEVSKAIRCVADHLGVDEDDAISVAECESHLRPRAVNGSYRGVYQIGDVWEAWVRSYREIASRFDLRLSVWNARANVTIAIARARFGWDPWRGECFP